MSRPENRILGWRALLEGRLPEAEERLTFAESDRALSADERAHVGTLLARLEVLKGNAPAALRRLKAARSPQARMLKGLLALASGDSKRALSLLVGAWDNLNHPPRLAPALALAALARGDFEQADSFLAGSLTAGVNAAFARSWLNHHAGRPGTDGFREVVAKRPGHLGAWFALAGLSADPGERPGQGRSWGRRPRIPACNRNW